MPRPEKVQAVADIKERLEGARAVFIAEYSGLSVKEQQQLRRALRASEGEFKVVKMTLARRAASELGYEGLDDMLVGPTGLTFADHDAAATAKALSDFAKDHAKLVIKGAVLSGKVLLPERVSELAELEPRDVLLAKVAGVFQAPMARMAGLLAAMPRNMATMVQQLVERAGGAEEPAAEEPAAPERPEAPADAAAEAAAAEPATTDETPAAEGAGDEPSAAEASTDDTAADEADDTQADEADDTAADQAEEE